MDETKRVFLKIGQTLQLEGGGTMHFHGGAFYCVELALAEKWIAEKAAADPDAPAAPAAEKEG